MVYHTQYSSFSTPFEKAPIWNPSQVLGIINSDTGSQTCIGHAPSQGRRCRNPINASNRGFVKTILEEVASLPPNDPVVMARLRTIAGPALCVRNHQGQVEEVLREWRRKVQRVIPSITVQKPVKRVQTVKLESVPDRDDLQSRLKEMREMKDMLAMLQEELNNLRYQDRKSEEQTVRGHQGEESRTQRADEVQRGARRKQQLERERLEREHQEKQRLETEARKRKEEAKQQRERERATQNERIRLRAQKQREERERQRISREAEEAAEWSQIWTSYEEKWADFKSSNYTSDEIRDAIPWPVKSGLGRDVRASNVREFFQEVVSRGGVPRKLLRKEALKWHPDKTAMLLGGALLGVGEKMRIEMICRELMEVLSSGR